VPMKHPCLVQRDEDIAGQGLQSLYHVPRPALRARRGAAGRRQFAAAGVSASTRSLVLLPSALVRRHSLRCLDTDDDNRLPGHRRRAT
jgi:hypothetical protein